MTSLTDRLAQLSDEQRAALATRLRAARGNGSPAVAPGGIAATARNGDALTLSFTQERIWFLEQFAPGTALHNMSGVARIPVRMQPATFAACLDEVVQRHEILRTRFAMRDGGPVGVVEKAATVPLRILDAVSDEERERQFAEDARQPFDLSVAPLLRMTIAPAGDDCYVQLTMHHIVSDGFSTGVFFGELGELYRAAIAGAPARLGPLPFQFADLAVWERAQLADGAFSEMLEHWKGHLDGAPQRLALPADHARPTRVTYRGGCLPVEIPGDLVDKVRAFSTASGVTPFTTMLAAFVVVVARYAAQDDLVLGVPVANREQPGTDTIIGPCFNTLALRFDIAADPSFAELVEQVNRTALRGFEHQALPFERVVQAVRATRDPSRSPLFQIAFNYQFDKSAAAGATGIELRDLPNGCCQFDLILSLTANGNGIGGHVDYYADVYDEATVVRVLDSYIALLRAALPDAQRPVSKLPLVSAEHISAVIARATVTGASFRESRTLPEFVLERGRSHPDRVALVGGERTLTYAEVDGASAALAAQLRSKVTAAPGAHVAVCLPRSPDMIVAVLGVLRAGFAYVPLDPTYPPERLAYICRDAQIAALVTRSDLRAVVAPADVPTIHLDDPPPAAELDVRSDVAATPDQCAYTIYTSGSTGQPKGVKVSHRNAVNLLESMRRRPGLDERDVLLAVTSPSFDIALVEMLLPLAVGALTVVAEQEDVTDGRRLAALLDEHAVTYMQGTPATWHLMVESGWPGREGLIALCCGEAFPAKLASDLLARCAKVYNGYGPTETTVYSTLHRVTERDVRDGVIPIGLPIANTTAFVLDSGLTPVPQGVLGELFVGGCGVAIGYHDRPELTASQFHAAPFHPGHRLFRTSDLVREHEHGVLEFAGRHDHQVKIRGHRIELGEIETVLETHPGVGRAVAVVRDDTVQDKAIICYAEPAATPRTDVASTADLTEYLRERLPAYMVPARIVTIAELPLTPNGKIDRKRLPEPEDATSAPAGGEAAGGRAGFVAPSTETEETLAAIWRDLLGIDSVGVQDGFFAVGGHSLLATKLVFRIREAFGVDLPLRVLFDGEPTIARLAALLSGDASGAIAVGGHALDLAEEARLADDIRPDPAAHVHCVRHPQHVLFTGATGFLGAFLLAELLRTTEATVYCLVRAASVAEGHDRIRGALTEYGIWEPSFAERIIPVLGTLSRARLGLSRPAWQHLAAIVDVIYHCAAEVNFLQGYHALKPANVLGTQEVLRLACTGSVKPVHFVSTTYVFSRFAYPPDTELTEDMDPIQDLEYTFGYTQSKWVAEQMVLEAGRRGVPVYVYRANRVSGHSETGACHTYDLMWQAARVGIEIGAAPLMDMTIDLTPVDYVVSALAHLSRQPDLRGKVFHLVSHDPIPEPELVAWLEEYGYRGERLSFGAWCQRVEQRAAELSDRTAGALAPFLSGTLPLDRLPSARFDDRNVRQGLVGTQIECPVIDDRLLRLYLDYFTSTGYLPAPQDRVIAAVGATER